MVNLDTSNYYNILKLYPCPLGCLQVAQPVGGKAENTGKPSEGSLFCNLELRLNQLFPFNL